MNSDEDGRPSPVERLLDAASRLFYARGAANVGINEIIDRAQVARMTLYHHFPSKDALLQAVLERRAAERMAWLRRADDRAEAADGRLLAVFDLLREWVESPDYRGCPLVNATIELGGKINPARPIARDYHQDVRAYLTELVRAAGAADPEALAWQLQLLLDGATVQALVSGTAEPAWHARQAAERLIAAERKGVTPSPPS
ncbi:MAG TPA: helix-turn-helix domain-containing protein [Trueperaceae bacterium]|nr:helix-turn-helix domain-containing protein [Trueperaceae bacterium]